MDGLMAPQPLSRRHQSLHVREISAFDTKQLDSFVHSFGFLVIPRSVSISVIGLAREIRNVVRLSNRQVSRSLSNPDDITIALLTECRDVLDAFAHKRPLPELWLYRCWGYHTSLVLGLLPHFARLESGEPLPYWTTDASPDVLGRVFGRSDARQKVRSGDKVTVKVAGDVDDGPVLAFGGPRGRGGRRGGRQQPRRGVRKVAGSVPAVVLGFTNVRSFSVEYVSITEWFASSWSRNPQQWLCNPTVVLPVSVCSSGEPLNCDPSVSTGSLSVVVQCDGEDFQRMLPVDEAIRSVTHKAEHKLAAKPVPLEEPVSFEEFACLIREAHPWIRMMFWPPCQGW
jgi:hypothetical protein